MPCLHADRQGLAGEGGGRVKWDKKDLHLFRGTRSIDTALEGRTFSALVARELGKEFVQGGWLREEETDKRAYALCGRSATLGVCTRGDELMG